MLFAEIILAYGVMDIKYMKDLISSLFFNSILQQLEHVYHILSCIHAAGLLIQPLNLMWDYWGGQIIREVGLIFNVLL